MASQIAAGAVERVAAALPEWAYATTLVGFLLFVGLAPWYHPTVFLYLFDGQRLDPWPQLLFTPAAYVGAWLAAASLGAGLLFVQGVVTVGVAATALTRHRRRPLDRPWPSKTVATVLAVVGGVLVVAGLVRSPAFV